MLRDSTGVLGVGLLRALPKGVVRLAFGGVFLGSVLTATAHPGNGIVVLGEGRVLTGDAVRNGTWQFSAGRPPVRQMERFHCHWLTRGQDGRLYAENQSETNGRWRSTRFRLDASGGGAVPIGTGPLHHSIFAVDRRGKVVVVDAGRVVQVDSEGGLLPWRGDGKVAPGEPALGSVSSFAWGPADTLYLADGAHIRKVGPDGVVRLVKTLTGKVTVPLFGGQGGVPRVWGVAVDDSGRVYAAVPGLGQVVRIEVDGKVGVVRTLAKDGWLATGLAVQGDRLYVLESRISGGENEGPRVRMRSGGQWVLLGTVRSRS